MCALPNAFLIEVFVSQIDRSQYPPNQPKGAFVENFHSMPFRLNTVLTSSELSNSVNASAADVYVVALSDIITCGNDLRATKRQNASRNVGTERSVTTSRCTAIDVAQVNRQI